jgi:ubiquitin carboxyl-terminal hydrolase 47
MALDKSSRKVQQYFSSHNWVNDDSKHILISLFRDRREELKQLSSEERKEIANKEGSRVNRFGSTVSSYSPRKERALKIYLDTSPRRCDDVELD